MKKKLILIGAGGYAKSVIDSLELDKYEIVGFIDDIKKGEHLGYKILGSSLDNFNSKNYLFFVCIGDNKKRTNWYNKILEEGLEIINVIGKLAIVNSDVTLGNNIIINTKALLEHGTSVGDNSNVSTNTAVNGDTKIGKSCFIGSSSVLNGQLTIGDGAIIGSGTVVIKDVKENTTVVGVPGRVIKGE